jgi:predicted glycosyltransferase involved in capsule biosynthesis
MARNLPPITEVKECPYCGNDEFYIRQTYSGTGNYYMSLTNQPGVDNADMYHCLHTKAGKTAYCQACEKPIAVWESSKHEQLYTSDYKSPFDQS